MASASAATVLSAAEIKFELVDRTFAYKGVENGRRKQGRIFYESNGHVRSLIRLGVRDCGRWKVDRSSPNLGQNAQMKT